VEIARIAALLAPFLAGGPLTSRQLGQVSRYLDLLLRWNARINLTAVRQPEQIVTRHFGESLFAARHLYPSRSLEPEARRLIDIGSGAGFPGLPIKMWASAVHATLLESNHRKATFLREVVRALQLTDVEVITGRAESYAEAVNAAGGAATANIAVTLRAVERFEQVLPTAVRLLEDSTAADRRLALLIGSAQIPATHELAPALTWCEALPIPQSSNRVLLIGSFSHE
jgi:16S rRNA (guanine527-N7)-methyltransferase